MTKEYEIKHEPVIPGYNDKDGNFIKTGELKDKWNIYYYHNGIQDGLKEFYSYDGINPISDFVLRSGYTRKNN